MELYFRDLHRTPLLTAPEEKALAHRIHAGDVEARELLIRANLRLVVCFARQYTRSGVGLPDLIAEGNLGLIHAVKGFDPARNTRFSTYAGWWIRQAIRRAVLRLARPVFVPAYLANLLVKWRRVAAQVQGELGRPGSHEEIADRLQLAPRLRPLVDRALCAWNTVPQEDASKEEPFVEMTLLDKATPTPSTRLETQDEVEWMLRLVSELDDRAAEVLRLRYGLNGEAPQTLAEIGRCLRLTRERVRQIELQALGQLRAVLGAA